MGTTLQLSYMAVGDGNGNVVPPDRNQTKLVSEKRRAPLNSLNVDPLNLSQIIAEQVIPEEVGGWWIRELGLYDKDGNLCAVANCAPSYKPQLAEGSGRTQVIRMVLIVSSTAAVELKIDPSVVLATRRYVDEQDAAHATAQDPHPQYLTEPEGSALIQVAVNKLVNGAPETLDTLAELAAALGNDPKYATTVANSLNMKAPLNSPALTGLPTGPTAPAGTNNAQLATTAFAQLAINNAIATAFTGANQSLASSGYQKLPGGLILQWGQVVTNGVNVPATWTYPISFPNAAVHVSAINLNSVGAAYQAYVYQAPSRFSAQIGCNYQYGASNFVFAIGF
ncbi:MAG: phage tail protein [Silvimonas sp.]|nr:phage tail protein [Silvimonas sp.]MDR3429016.1 phage tail protein [Silvimonas sp.]